MKLVGVPTSFISLSSLKYLCASKEYASNNFTHNHGATHHSKGGIMTYAEFLLLFLLLPLGILAAFLRKRLLDRRYLIVVGVLTLVALLYMAPWDHFAAIWGLWSWTNNRTWGLRWWAIPPEEYLFCALEALLAITLTFAVVTRNGARSELNIATSSGKMNSDGECTSTKLYNSPVPTKDEKVDREAKS